MLRKTILFFCVFTILSCITIFKRQKIIFKPPFFISFYIYIKTKNYDLDTFCRLHYKNNNMYDLISFDNMRIYKRNKYLFLKKDFIKTSKLLFEDFEFNFELIIDAIIKTIQQGNIKYKINSIDVTGKKVNDYKIVLQFVLQDLILKLISKSFYFCKNYKFVKLDEAKYKYEPFVMLKTTQDEDLF